MVRGSASLGVEICGLPDHYLILHLLYDVRDPQELLNADL